MRERWPRVTLISAARRTLGDPGPLVVAVAFYVIVAGVLATLWSVAAEAQGDVVGYSARQLVWYAVVSEAAVVALHSRLIEYVSDDISSGAVAVELLRPASVLGVRVWTEVGRVLPRLGGCVIAAVPLALWLGGRPPSAAALALVPASLVLAVVANLLGQFAVSGVAFWLRDARSTWFLYQKFVFITGGMLLPLQVLPDALESVAMVLPFMAMAYAPARLASGHFEPALLAVQLGWCIVLWFAATAVFAAGERRLQVVGG